MLAAWLLRLKVSMTFMETYPIYVACALWGSHLRQRRILLRSDNEGTVAVWARGSSRNVAIIKLVRRIHFLSAENNFVVKVVHIAGHNNSIADSLCRFQQVRFYAAAPLAHHHGLATPDLLSRLRPLMEASIGLDIWTELPMTSSNAEQRLLPEELTNAYWPSTSLFFEP